MDVVKKEAEINWQDSAETIERKIRAFNSWPVCFTYAGENRLRLWHSEILDEPSEESEKADAIQPGRLVSFDKKGIQVECGDGKTLLLTQLQADGSRSMSAAELLNSKNSWFTQLAKLGG